MYKIIIILLFLFPSCSFTQQDEGAKTIKHEKTNCEQVLFYNVENLFDTSNDSTRAYNEFSPESSKKWNTFKFNKKVNEIAKCISAASEQSMSFIGLAEIENKAVLKRLRNHPLLRPDQYEIIHFESQDVRGIDVGFLYKKSKFDLLSFKRINVPLKKRPTRDILLIMGVHPPTQDTLMFFINHWSSRYGGKKRSEKSRVLAARILKKHMDSLELTHPSCKIIATGDFNDSPQDSSLKNVLVQDQYINLFADSVFSYGSLKYKRNWQVFDQFIVNKNLLKKRGLQVNSVKIFSPMWLMEKDKKYGGQKPFRTYYGPRYHGGISDHLPIVLTLEF